MCQFRSRSHQCVKLLLSWQIRYRNWWGCLGSHSHTFGKIIGLERFLNRGSHTHCWPALSNQNRTALFWCESQWLVLYTGRKKIMCPTIHHCRSDETFQNKILLFNCKSTKWNYSSICLSSFVSAGDAEHFHHDDYDRGIHVHSDDHDGVRMTMITTNLSFECFFSEIVVEVSLFVEFNYHLIANNFQF